MSSSLLCRITGTHSFEQWHQTGRPCTEVRRCSRDGTEERRINHHFADWSAAPDRPCMQIRRCTACEAFEKSNEQHDWEFIKLKENDEYEVFSRGRYKPDVTRCRRCQITRTPACTACDGTGEVSWTVTDSEVDYGNASQWSGHEEVAPCGRCNGTGIEPMVDPKRCDLANTSHEH